jgi:hypothetical protein
MRGLERFHWRLAPVLVSLSMSASGCSLLYGTGVYHGHTAIDAVQPYDGDVTVQVSKDPPTVDGGLFFLDAILPGSIYVLAWMINDAAFTDPSRSVLRSSSSFNAAHFPLQMLSAFATGAVVGGSFSVAHALLDFVIASAANSPTSVHVSYVDENGVHQQSSVRLVNHDSGRASSTFKGLASHVSRQSPRASVSLKNVFGVDLDSTESTVSQ